MTISQMPEWSQAMSVGNVLIDAQHRQLLGLGRQALELLQAPVLDPVRFHALLNDIADATRQHFETEEAILQAHQCPFLDAHRAEHDRYRERLTELLFDGIFGAGDRDGLARLIHELITEHVLQRDVPLKEYMS